MAFVVLGLYVATRVDARVDTSVEPLADSQVNPLTSVDLQEFSDRATTWSQAHQQHRQQTHERAMSLAQQTRASQDTLATPAPTTTATPTTTRVPAATTTTAAAAATTATTTTTATATTVATAGEAASTITTPGTTEATVTTTTVTATTTTEAAATPTEEQWEALRQCESSGNYQAINPSGRYRGAYQFSRRTWDWVAGKIGADHLVGIDPAAASPPDQDQMALALWELNGWTPWPTCSKRLGYR